jgi:hypothetical protein
MKFASGLTNSPLWFDTGGTSRRDDRQEQFAESGFVINGNSRNIRDIDLPELLGLAKQLVDMRQRRQRPGF